MEGIISILYWVGVIEWGDYDNLGNGGIYG